MMKWLFAVLVMVFATAVGAVDVTLRFDPVVGATDYRIEHSTDVGATWPGSQLTGGLTTYTYTGVPEGGLVLFRVASINAVTEATRLHSGFWYDYRNLPLDSPSFTGIE